MHEGTERGEKTPPPRPPVNPLQYKTRWLEPDFIVRVTGTNLLTRFYFCVPVHRSVGQINHQRDATLCRFYFSRLTLHVSGVKRPSSGVLKTGTVATGTCVMVAGRSSHHHIRDETLFRPLYKIKFPGKCLDLTRIKYGKT